MARERVTQSPVVHIFLLILFLLPLFFVRTQRSSAQAPYPTPTTAASVCTTNGGVCYPLSYNCGANGLILQTGWACPDVATQKCCTGVPYTPTPTSTSTPVPSATLIPSETPILTCIGTDQAEACSQTSQCTGCLPASYTCQGYIPGVQCGTCYCTNPNPTPGTCGPWGNCNYDPVHGWCETRFCDYNGCTCNAANPGCCTYQIRCPCTPPTSGAGTTAPTNTPGGATSTPTRTPTPTPTSPAGTCAQLWYCRKTDWNCTQTVGTYDLTTHLTCPASAPTCEDYLLSSVPNTTNICYNQEATCQAACTPPTLTPIPTVTPGGPTITNTPTPLPAFCDIIGNKYIADIAGPVGLCDDPTDSCVPAIVRGITL